MRKLTKRVLAVLLSLAMTVGLIFPNPIQAKAGDQVDISFNLTPADATLVVQQGGETVAPDANSGKYKVDSTLDVTYTATCEGYETINGIVPGSTEVPISNNTNIDVTMLKIFDVTIDASNLFTSLSTTFGTNILDGLSISIQIDGKTVKTLTSTTPTWEEEVTENTIISYAVNLTSAKYLIFHLSTAAMSITVTGTGPKSYSIDQSILGTFGTDYELNVEEIKKTLSISETSKTIESGAEPSVISVNGVNGWNATVTFSESNENITVTQDGSDQSKATILGKKRTAAESPVPVTASVKIGDTDITSFVTNVTVTPKPVNFTVAVTPTDNNWKSDVTFNITADPATIVKDQNFIVNFTNAADSTIVIPTKTVTFDQDGKAQVSVNGKNDLKLNKKDNIILTGEFNRIVEDVDYYGKLYYTYEPGLATQEPYVLTRVQENGANKQWHYGDADSTPPEGCAGVLVGTITEGTDMPDTVDPLYEVVEVTPEVAKDYIKVTRDGQIWVDIQHIGANTVKFKVQKNGDGANYSAYTPDTFEEVVILPYEIKWANLPHSYSVTSRDYNGETGMEVTSFSLVNLPYGESGSSLVTATANADTKDVGVEKTVTLSAITPDSSWTGSSNYKIPDTLNDDTAKGTITPAKLTITVTEGEIAWNDVKGEEDVATLITKGKWKTIPEVTLEGFVNGETLADFSYTLPELKIDSSAYTSPEVKPYPGVIYAKADTGSAPSNYVYDFVNQIKGKLVVDVEPVTDGYDYLRINDSSTNVYQDHTSSEKTIYYGSGNTAIFDIQNKTDYKKIYAKINGSFTELTSSAMSIDTSRVTFYLADEDDKIKTAEFDLEFKEDIQAPQIDIKIDAVDSIVTDFSNIVTFNLFDNGKRTKELKTVITVADGENESGIKEWKYVVINADKDADFTKLSDPSKITEADVNALFSKVFTKVTDGYTVTEYLGRTSAEDQEVDNGNYIVFVLAIDNVNNATLYSSHGVIIENIPVSAINYSYSGDTPVPIKHDGRDYFNTDVTLETEVVEATDSYFSGVASMTASITQDTDVTTEELITAKEVDASLADIKKDYGTVPDKDLKIAAQEGSKDVKVSFTAYDNAGNTLTNSTSFVIDPVAPVVDMKVSSAADCLNGKYYNDDVTVTLTITERYLDLDAIQFMVNVDGVNKEAFFDTWEVGKYGLKSKTVVKQTDYTSDEQQTVLVLTFGEDHAYKLNVKLWDRAQNKAYAKTDEFVVDKTAPSVTVTYYGYGDGATFTPGTTEAARTYLNADYSSFKAVIAVNELNFSDGSTVNATYKVTAVDSEGKEVSGINVKDVTAPASWESKKYSVDYTVDANYTFEFDYTDLAGNKATVNVNPTYITLDKVVPEGTVTVSNMVNGDASKTWDALVSAITFGLFGKDSITASMTSKDATAGVATTQYLATSELLSKAALAARTDWTDYKSAIALAANENVIVYEKVTDKAGNVEFYSSENIVVDNTDPAPEVTIVPTVPAWNKGVYAATDKPGFDIIVTDPIKNGAYSGLQTITYKITAGSVEETGELASYTKGSHTQEFKGHVDIDPEKFYSNDVQVTVTASDFSTNEATSETKTLKIDSKAPVVSFSFDTSDAQNGKYYNKEKTLTITVDERNFDPSYEPTVTSTTGGGYSFSGWTTNGETTTGTVTFSGDSDYTVTFDCYDLAGNKSNTENLEEFTVDMTNPVISVSYDNNNATNGNYYKAERTATITIEEHNFNSGNVSTTITAELDGESIDVPVVSEWASNGDTHTATVRYPGDGDYTFNISYVDQAGNTASEYKGDAFTVDKTNPELTISGVQDKSANNGTVAPVINASDINFNSDNLTWTLTGVNNPDVDASGLVMINATEQSATITFSNFPEGMDDIYTLTAKAVDAAGNETTKSITFSVNRDGSTYIINESTQKLIDKQITNNPQDIVITEINVDTLEFIELSYTKDGQVIKLEEGKDYTVEEAGGDGQWKQYTYTIKATAFSEEGEYSINIYSEDTATNSSTNKAKEMIIDFIVDKTAPTVAVANLEDMGRYQEEAHEFNVTVKDNAVLAKLEIYRDGELWQSIEGTDLLTPEGYLTISLPEAGQYQDIELIAYDAVGNVTEPLDYRVLVTSNGWIQFYNNKPLFGGSIAGVAAVGGVIAFLIAKRKKKEEDK